MYKETVISKKIVSLIRLIFIIVFSIVISDLITSIKLFGVSDAKYSSRLVFALTIIIIYKEITKCKLKFKYSIIADQFIVYKVKGAKQEIMENIKINDIQSVDKLSRKKINFGDFMVRKYTSLTITPGIYCCTYKNKNKTQKFYFEPSSCLVSKLNSLKNKESKTS